MGWGGGGGGWAGALAAGALAGGGGFGFVLVGEADWKVEPVLVVEAVGGRVGEGAGVGVVEVCEDAVDAFAEDGEVEGGYDGGGEDIVVSRRAGEGEQSGDVDVREDGLLDFNGQHRECRWRCCCCHLWCQAGCCSRWQGGLGWVWGR